MGGDRRGGGGEPRERKKYQRPRLSKYEVLTLSQAAYRRLQIYVVSFPRISLARDIFQNLI